MKTLEVQRPQKSGDLETLHCLRQLREVPRQREVCAGTWNGRPVVIKIFYCHWKARRHLRREWQGLQEMQKRDLPAPRPLLFGKTTGGWTLVTEEIQNAQILLDRLKESGRTAAAEIDILLRYLAAMHEAGVIQQDLHPGNFLLAGQTLYALDPARMRFSNQPVPMDRRLQNLALLFSALPPRHRRETTSFLDRYFEILNRPCGDKERRQFENLVTRLQRQGLEKAVRKTTRSCTRFRRIRTAGARGVFRRDFCDESAANDLASRLDEVMERGQILKRGNTCTVCRVEIAGRDAVIKRYNHKGWWHSLRHTLKGSRARKCWQHGYRLAWAGIPTPLPLAFIETMNGPLVRQSYLVYEYVPGTSLREFLLQAPEADRQQAVEKARAVIESLGRLGVSHNDLKLNNFLVNGEGLHLIDLDSMKHHRFRRPLRSACENMRRDFEARLRPAREQSPR